MPLVWESKDVTFEDVKISYMHGFGLLVEMSENVYFNRLRMETDIETGKTLLAMPMAFMYPAQKGKLKLPIHSSIIPMMIPSIFMERLLV